MKNEQILMLYDEMEHELKRARMFLCFFVLTYIILIFCYIFMELNGLVSNYARSNVLKLALLLPGVIGAGKTNYSRRMASRKYKVLLVWNALEKTFENLEFRPDLGLSPNQIYWTNLASFGSSFSANDYIKATYNGTNFEQSDVKANHFKGRVMIFEFNKTFKYNIHVCENGFKYNKSRSDVLYSDERKFERIELEDMEFNDKFKVYAQKQDEAFYILTPHISESIKRLQEQTRGKILLCFVGSHLHVAINDRRDSFEPPIFGKVNLFEASKEVYDEIKLITNFVDELKLNNNIYKS